MKIIIIGYEPTQATVLEQHSVRLRQDGHNVCIVTFDQELEWLLEEAGLTFISSRNYRRGDRLKNLEYTEHLVTNTRNNYLLPLSYQGITLDTIFGFSLHVYIQRWLYFAEAFSEMLESEKPDWTYICAPYFSPQIEKDTFLYYENEAPTLCLKTLCDKHGISCEIIGESVMNSLPQTSGTWGRMFKIGLDIFNVFMGVFQNKNNIRILASEYWRHIAPVFDELPHSTLTLYDRKELRNIPLKTVFRNRMRFMHGPENISSEAFRRVMKAEERINSIWKSQRENLLRSSWSYKEYDMSVVIVKILDDVIMYRLRSVLVDIERVYALLHKVQPNVVLLRATVSSQPHFPILAQASRKLGIPAIELQHGIEIFAPGSISRLHVVEHMGLYGELIKQEMVRNTHQKPRLSIIGSLNFDSLYSIEIPLESDGEELVCIAPDIFFSPVYDTYDAYEYFCAVAEVARAVDIRVRVKLRNASRRQPFYTEAVRRAFKDTDCVISQDETIFESCRNAKLAVCCFSTSALELLKCGVPTIIAALFPAENNFVSFHFSQYEKENALKIARTTDEFSFIVAELLHNESLRRSLKQDALKFLSNSYSLDGCAAQRLATLIKKLVRPNK